MKKVEQWNVNTRRKNRKGVFNKAGKNNINTSDLFNIHNKNSSTNVFSAV